MAASTIMHMYEPLNHDELHKITIYSTEPSAARNSDVIINSDAFDIHYENHGKQLQIVKSQNDQLSRFAIVSRDFLWENQKRRSFGVSGSTGNGTLNRKF